MAIMSESDDTYKQQLAASEARFRNIINRNADATIIVDQQGIIRFANPAAAALFQQTTQALLGLTFGYPIVKGDKTELCILRKELPSAIVEMRVVAIEWDGELAFLASLRDITQRKQIELMERDRSKILELIVRNKPLGIILNQIVRMIARNYPHLWCAILMQQEDRFVFKAGTQMPAAYIEAIQRITMESNTCPCHQAMVNKHPISILTSETLCPASCMQFLPTTIHACYALPLITQREEVSGVLVLYLPQRSDLTNTLKNIARVAAHLATIAIKQRSLTRKLTYHAYHDSLTGLPNRSYFEERLQQEIAKSGKDQHLAVFFIDLDRFKQVNDTLGHSIGDRLLQQVAGRFSQVIRSQDLLARMGGDEFMLMMPEIHQKQQVSSTARQLLSTLHEPFIIEEHDLYVSASIGISISTSTAYNSSALQRSADIAMYHAKHCGGNMYSYYSPSMQKPDKDRLQLESHLRRAIERNELLMYYQPQVDQNGKFMGAEALLRWNHPQLGMISPGNFIPLAEENGLIIPIGTWALNEVCRQHNAWRQSGFPSFKIAINVSALQFAQPDFVSLLAEALQHNKMTLPHLEIEITESVLIMDHHDVAQKLSLLQKLGVRIAIDDFGTGYSSMLSLQRLPINTLKIDQVFIQHIGTQAIVRYNDSAIIGAVTFLAYSLGIGVVAEGIETEAQFQFVRDAGCNGAQGNLFSPALSTEAFEALLKDVINGVHPRITALS
jgi:diguanylate cyclase (GGDEF)-like protein